MNFQLSEEQQMLADSAKRFVRDNSNVESHRQNKKQIGRASCRERV